MRRSTLLLATATLTLGLTACGKSDHDVLVQACVDKDTSSGYCECAVASMEKNVSPEIPKKLADQIRSKGKTREEAENALTAQEKIELLKVFPLTFQCVGEE